MVAAVAALELVQASALIHDDLMDGSDTRRGEPAVHRRFAALHAERRLARRRRRRSATARRSCSATCAWSGPTSCCTSAGSTRRTLARARPVFDEMRTEVTVGQYLDVLDPGHRRHLGASGPARWPGTSRRSTRSSGRCCSAPRWPARRDRWSGAYSAFGLPLGEAFQLRDDVLGVFGDPAQTGKPAGDDLREGKRTYLVAAAFDARRPGRPATSWTAGLGDPRLDDAGVARLRAIITASGALARTEERIAALTASALAALAGRRRSSPRPARCSRAGRRGHPPRALTAGPSVTGPSVAASALPLAGAGVRCTPRRPSQTQIDSVSSTSAKPNTRSSTGA